MTLASIEATLTDALIADAVGALDDAETAIRLIAKSEHDGADVGKVERALRRDLSGLTRMFAYNVYDDMRWDLLTDEFGRDAKMIAYALDPRLSGGRVRTKQMIARLLGEVPFIETDLFVDQADDMWRAGYLRGYNTGAGWAARTISRGVVTDFALRDPNILQAINARAATRARLFTAEIAEATNRWLVSGMYDRGQSPRALRSAFRSQGIKDIAGWRVDRIARTEAVISTEHGKFDTALRSGVEYIEWQAHIDSVTRESHVNLDGQEVRLGEFFSNGLRHPGDWSGPSEEIVNCRCTSAPVPSDRIDPERVWRGD